MAHDSDFVIARIRCPKCGQESDERLQVYLRDVDYGGEFKVGDAYAPDLDHLDVGYYVLRRPHAGEPLRVAVHTGCDACPYDYVWSRVILADGVIRSTDGVVLDREVVDSLHVIDDILRAQYRERGGVDLKTMSETDRAAYILAHPPAELTPRES
ncbi:MAG: hypothetical protein RIT81_07525 [Deltaproteobacteria bacterium]